MTPMTTDEDDQKDSRDNSDPDLFLCLSAYLRSACRTIAMRIVMMGTGTFAEPTFEALLAAEARTSSGW